MKKYLKYITCLLVSLLLITTCFATAEDSFDNTFTVDITLSIYTRTDSGNANIYDRTISNNAFVVGTIYSGDTVYLSEVFSVGTVFWGKIYSVNEDETYKGCYMSLGSTKYTYMGTTTITVETDIEDSSDIVTPDTDISSSIVSDEETKGILYMILGILIFFLICVLCTYIYKFFKMFF